MANLYQAEIDKAVQESEAACKAATENTPEQYRSFLYFMTQGKKIGPKNSKIYAAIRIPSIRAAGRILWAREDHVQRDERLDIATSFERNGEHVICKAVVASSYRGSATGHSVVKPGESGIEAEYPAEKAETTAVSRALGFLGYGILDAGIAPAEDLMDSESETDASARSTDNEPVQPEPASEKQMGLLYSELARCGVREGDKRSLIAMLYGEGITKADASQEIKVMKLKNILHREWLKPYLRMLCERQGLQLDAMNSHIRNVLKIENFDKMSRKQQDILIEWVATWTPEKEPRRVAVAVEESDDIPDNIYRPGEAVNPQTQTLADQWTEVIGTICQANPDYAREDVVSWLLDEIGSGEYQDVYSMPKPRLGRVQRMAPEMVTKAIAAHIEHRQPSLPL